MSFHIEATIEALTRQKVRFLPRGELFISKGFLDCYFSESKYEPAQQLEAAACSLGLDVVGIDLNAEWSLAPLSKGAYKKLSPFFTVGCLDGPMAHFIQHLGFRKAMLTIKEEPSSFSIVANSLIKEVERQCRLARANGFKAIAIADDIAGKGGLIVSYDFFESAVWPCYRKMAEIIKANSFYAFFHSDGDIKKVVELLIDAGYDCLHPIDSQAGMNLREMRQSFAEKICFMGHIDLFAWDEGLIKKEIKVTEDDFANGGLILGSSCGISMESAQGALRALYSSWRQDG